MVSFPRHRNVSTTVKSGSSVHGIRVQHKPYVSLLVFEHHLPFGVPAQAYQRISLSGGYVAP
jgi:hypothetical protein